MKEAWTIRGSGGCVFLRKEVTGEVLEEIEGDSTSCSREPSMERSAVTANHEHLFGFVVNVFVTVISPSSHASSISFPFLLRNLTSALQVSFLYLDL